jgi:hypothetical protein
MIVKFQPQVRAASPIITTSPVETAQPAPASNGTVDTLERVSKPAPPFVQALKKQILAIASANTTRTDNIKEVRAQLDPLVRQLAVYFAANRPADEAQKTQGVWKNVWYDNPDIDRGPFFLKLKRETIYQVVEPGYYYNVSDSRVRVLGLPLGTIHSFLRGNYSIIRPATEQNKGEEGLNTIALEFADLRFKFGRRPTDEPIREQVRAIAERETFSLPSPGPRGVKGELWNLYLDDDVRIAAGFQADKPSELQLYVLQREA